MNTIGSIEVTIRVRLNQDVTVEEARKFIEEMDYEIKDTTGVLSIAETEVIGDNVDDSCSGVRDVCPLEDCIHDGMHLQDCDKNGNCKVCGCSDTVEEATAAIEAKDSRRGLHGAEYKGEKF